MRFRYYIDFRCSIALFADFFRGIAVLGTPPPNVPLYNQSTKWTYLEFELNLWLKVKRFFIPLISPLGYKPLRL